MVAIWKTLFHATIEWQFHERLYPFSGRARWHRRRLSSCGDSPGFPVHDRSPLAANGNLSKALGLGAQGGHLLADGSERLDEFVLREPRRRKPGGPPRNCT
jgi:hypothetical protein